MAITKRTNVFFVKQVYSPVLSRQEVHIELENNLDYSHILYAQAIECTISKIHLKHGTSHHLKFCSSDAM